MDDELISARMGDWSDADIESAVVEASRLLFDAIEFGHLDEASTVRGWRAAKRQSSKAAIQVTLVPMGTQRARRARDRQPHSLPWGGPRARPLAKDRVDPNRNARSHRADLRPC